MSSYEKLYVDSFKRALEKLRVGVVRALATPGDEELRDACIQRFEYSFELCWKLLKRQLELELQLKTEVDSFSKKQLFRVAAERGLIDDVNAWFVYLEMRNLSSHTYQFDTATQVFSVIPSFLEAAENLLQVLSVRYA